MATDVTGVTDEGATSEGATSGGATSGGGTSAGGATAVPATPQVAEPVGRPVGGPAGGPAGRSRSSLLLLAILVAGVVFAAAVQIPAWWRARTGVVDVQPQLLLVRPGAKGRVDLGGGMAVSVFDDGMRLLLGDHVIFQSVPLGSMLSAGRGGADPRARTERVSSTLDSLEITAVRRLPSGARYTGRLFDRTTSWPASITIARSGNRIDLTASVPRAQLLVLHSAREHVTVGLPPRLVPTNLRQRVWWPTPLPALSVSGAAYTTLLGSTIGVLSRAPTALDLRYDGRTDVHVWAPSLTLTVTWYGATRAGGGLIRPA